MGIGLPDKPRFSFWLNLPILLDLYVSTHLIEDAYDGWLPYVTGLAGLVAFLALNASHLNYHTELARKRGEF